MATVVFSAVAVLIVLVVVVALDVTKDASPRKKRTERPFANSQRRKTRSNDKVPALQYCDFACSVVMVIIVPAALCQIEPNLEANFWSLTTDATHGHRTRDCRLRGSAGGRLCCASSGCRRCNLAQNVTTTASLASSTCNPDQTWVWHVDFSS